MCGNVYSGYILWLLSGAVTQLSHLTTNVIWAASPILFSQILCFCVQDLTQNILGGLAWPQMCSSNPASAFLELGLQAYAILLGISAKLLS